MKKKRLGSIVMMIAVAVAVIAGWILASGYFTVKNAGYTMETMEDVLEGKKLSPVQRISADSSPEYAGRTGGSSQKQPS